MADHPTKLDGNAAAGVLREIFPFEITMARSACAGCARQWEIGALAAYLDCPGVVLRCPSCEAVMLRAVHGSGRYWLEVSGMLFLELPEPGVA